MLADRDGTCVSAFRFEILDAQKLRYVLKKQLALFQLILL